MLHFIRQKKNFQLPDDLNPQASIILVKSQQCHGHQAIGKNLFSYLMKHFLLHNATFLVFFYSHHNQNYSKIKIENRKLIKNFMSPNSKFIYRVFFVHQICSHFATKRVLHFINLAYSSFKQRFLPWYQPRDLMMYFKAVLNYFK